MHFQLINTTTTKNYSFSKDFEPIISLEPCLPS